MCSSFNATLEHVEKGEWWRTDGMWSIAQYQYRTKEVTGNMTGMISHASRKWNER